MVAVFGHSSLGYSQEICEDVNIQPPIYWQFQTKEQTVYEQIVYKSLSTLSEILLAFKRPKTNTFITAQYYNSPMRTKTHTTLNRLKGESLIIQPNRNFTFLLVTCATISLNKNFVNSNTFSVVKQELFSLLPYSLKSITFHKYWEITFLIHFLFDSISRQLAQRYTMYRVSLFSLRLSNSYAIENLPVYYLSISKQNLTLYFFSNFINQTTL